MFCRLRWVRRGCAQWPQDARGSAVRAVWSGAAASSEHRSSSAASTQGKTQRQDQDPERLYRTDENMFKLLVTHEPSARQKRRYSGTWDWHLRMLLISLVPLAMSVLLERYIRHFWITIKRYVPSVDDAAILCSKSCGGLANVTHGA